MEDEEYPNLRKRWAVYGMTRNYPFARDTESAPNPEDEAVWEAVVESGDLLYIPAAGACWTAAERTHASSDSWDS